MTEKDFQTLFGHWLQENNPSQPECYELKICKTNRFPFSQVKDHQIEGLLKAQNKGMYHKISDSPIFPGMKTRFTTKKEFDCLWIKANGFVCVLFYVPRRIKTFVKIPILDFIKLKENYHKKSISLTEIVQFNFEIINL